MFAGTYVFAQPENDDCLDAIDLTSSLGQGVDNTITTGLYDNRSATNTNDPGTGYDCFEEPNGSGSAPSLDNTVWFKITGDGAAYDIEASARGGCGTTDPITNNDTQIAIYTGDCNQLEPLLGACNEDGPNASTADNSYPALVNIQTQVGEVYYILVDGFNFNGTVSVGTFCMHITMKGEYIACDHPNVSGGTITANSSVVCEGGTTDIVVTGAFAPNEGAVYGYAWVISDKDLEQDPTASYGVGFTIKPQPESPLRFDQSMIGPLSEPGTYYYTLITFGNGTPNIDSPMSIADVTLDQACTWLSNSVAIEYFNEEDCPVSILDIDESVLGMSVFPNPIESRLHLNINTKHTSEVRLFVSNITGKTVLQRTVDLREGEDNILAINVEDIPRGVYVIAIQNETHQSVTKLIKQ